MFFSGDRFRPGDDEIIIGLYQKGDGSRIETIIRKYESFVYGVCFKSCLKIKGYAAAHYQAQDLSQEVWRKVFQHASSYRPVSPFKAWLAAIAKNTVRDWLKKSYLREEVSDAEFLVADSPMGEAYIERNGSWESLPTHPDPETASIIKDIRNVLKACKNALDNDDRKIVELYLQEKTQREIATVLNLSLGGVNKRMKDLFQRLGRCFKEHGWRVEEMIQCMN